MKKKETPPPILYEKYKLEHGEKTGVQVHQEEKTSGKSPGKRAVSFFLTIILLGMVLLSAVGCIALLQPQMREILINLLGQR